VAQFFYVPDFFWHPTNSITALTEALFFGFLQPLFIIHSFCQCFDVLQCFDAHGWAAGRASGL